MTNYTLRKGNPATTKTDAVVIAVGRGPKGDAEVAPGGEAVVDAYGRNFRPMLSAAGFNGNTGETLRVPTAGVLRAANLVLVGIGDLDAVSPLQIQRAAGNASRAIGAASSVALALPANAPDEVAAALSGFMAGSYQFTKVGKPASTSVADLIVLSDSARRSDMTAAFESARLIETLASRTRDWANMPPNLLTPEVFAKEGQAFVSQ
ncbi:MAG TPA: M17 family peptidase N-terminal domain-containing protein, partial [Marmoricola sp.]|nr:M17 family peptidase N-terminal domain-containing protein [Marmoricola sp.]